MFLNKVTEFHGAMRIFLDFFVEESEQYGFFTTLHGFVQFFFDIYGCLWRICTKFKKFYTVYGFWVERNYPIYTDFVFRRVGHLILERSPIQTLNKHVAA